MNTVEISSQHIEFVFENCEAINVDVWAIETLNFDENWQENYNLAKSYYEYYGNLEIPSRLS